MAAAPPLYSTLFGDASKWSNPTPDYTALTTALAHGAANRQVVRDGTLGLATQTPVTIAFVVQGDDDHVCVGHSPVRFPVDPLNASVWPCGGASRRRHLH